MAGSPRRFSAATCARRRGEAGRAGLPHGQESTLAGASRDTGGDGQPEVAALNLRRPCDLNHRARWVSVVVRKRHKRYIGPPVAGLKVPTASQTATSASGSTQSLVLGAGLRDTFGGWPGGHRAADSFQERLDPEARARLELQSRSRRNLWLHARRAVVRVLVLVAGDLASLWLIRGALRAVRDHGLLGPLVGNYVGAMLPRGNLSGFQIGVALVLGLFVTGNYGEGDRRKDASRLLVGSALAIALPIWRQLWGGSPLQAALEYVLSCGLLWVGLVLERRSMDQIVDLVRSKVRSVSRVVFVGPADDCFRVIQQNGFAVGWEYEPVGVLDVNDPPHARAIGHVRALSQTLQESAADTVVLCGPLPDEVLSYVVDSSLAADCHLMSMPRSVETAGVTLSLLWRGGVPMVQLTRPALRGQQLFLKRVLDVVVAALALIVFSPLLLGLWALVRLDSPGPGLFAQPRLGRNGRTFRCLKFRTMHRDAEQRLSSDPRLYSEYLANNYKLPPAHDPRLTSLGRFLRRSSLDELPQLINVLRGEMSLVGPRPIVPDELEQYGKWSALFLSLKPGMTGAWAVNGRSGVSYPDRADLELNYVRSWSLLHDIAILLHTGLVVARRAGAY